MFGLTPVAGSRAHSLAACTGTFINRSFLFAAEGCIVVKNATFSWAKTDPPLLNR